MLSGKCFHLVLPSESKNEGMESSLYGVGSVVLLSVLMTEGRRELSVEEKAIRVRFVEEKKKEWMVMEEEEQAWITAEVVEEAKVKEEVEKQGSFGVRQSSTASTYSALRKLFPEEILNSALHSLLQKEELFCLFSWLSSWHLMRSPTECYFVAKAEKDVWAVGKGGQLFFPSALLCIEQGKRSERLRALLKKKVVYLVTSCPGISLVRTGCGCERRRGFSPSSTAWRRWSCSRSARRSARRVCSSVVRLPSQRKWVCLTTCSRRWKIRSDRRVC